jgi:hypothetical protein
MEFGSATNVETEVPVRVVGVGGVVGVVGEVGVKAVTNRS